MTYGLSYNNEQPTKKGPPEAGQKEVDNCLGSTHIRFPKNLFQSWTKKLAYYKAGSISRELENSGAIIILCCLPDSVLSDGIPTLHTHSSLLFFFLLVPNQESSIKAKMAPFGIHLMVSTSASYCRLGF